MMASHIVLLGPPGAGKGTQAKMISERFTLPHISSGEIFRENLRLGTELGKLAKGYLDRGELVPDSLTIALVRERISRPDCERGVLLDGFPRTVAQAIALDSLLAQLDKKINAVPFINVPEADLVERLTGRWTCRATGHVFHEKFHPPKQQGVCDEDGSELYQRDDDKIETVTRRINVYQEQTAPLIAYYRQQDKLLEVDGSRSIDLVAQDLIIGLKTHV